MSSSEKLKSEGVGCCAEGEEVEVVWTCGEV